ncbi:MAG TPA: DUF192 domain-containing protein, partial [Solirubrobacterales bacterium]|nr:DUF192 domain-containing protein [Solirubrobacterales bacterium]
RLRRLPIASVLGREVLVASTLRARLLGLAHLDRAGADPLLIPRCSCVHTFGMRFPLDLYFLDEAGAVLTARPGVPPRRVAFCGRAAAVLEIPTEQGGEFSPLRT